VLRSLRFILLAILFTVSASLAHADGVPVDPKMQVSDPSCGDGCTSLTGTSFTFSSNANGGGFLTFENDSDASWTSLLIEATGIAADAVNASSTLFSNPAQVYNIGDLLVIYFSGVSGPGCEIECFNGIPNLSDENVFTINLNDDVNEVANLDPSGSGGWGAGLAFDASANVPAPTNVPEPATLTLMAVGLGAFLVKKKIGSCLHSKS
jgi:hypothetical protein